MYKYILLLSIIAMALCKPAVSTGSPPKDELETFASALMTAIAADPTINYDLSGVAKVIKLGGSFVYSASLFNKDKNAVLVRPDEMFRTFQRLVVNGYTFRSVESLTFTSTSKLPLPAWRLQVKYTPSG
ncbi:MAG: hypothetical protein FNAVV1_gp3 [Fushun naranga aenescens virga-like virus 1]|nr:MAG: hypothetical protein FNAVV1_gp3 [Fushun naranga aenescens virga-like virus 1]